MSSLALQVDQIGKQYKLGLRETSKRNFGEALLHGLGAPLRRLRTLGEQSDGDDLFWALRDVTFDVKPGEVIGVIGQNGAGKSTLLKILSRVTHPTEGRAIIRGRVGSLLEVGTGFHPELSGRENIYLNGAVLGMKRIEIARKFDEIVAFSEIEKFLDTPVKRYSSGMYVRLAFAVAAHLEPEVLIVDEVLAVGDAAFQQKCLGKMGSVAGEGRTVLFVSHNMSAVRNLCPRAIMLANGRIAADGDSAEVIHGYLANSIGSESMIDVDLRNWLNRRGNGRARVTRARLLGENGQPSGVFERLKPMTIEFTIDSHCRSNLILSAICSTPDDGVKVLQMCCQDKHGFQTGIINGEKTVRIRIDSLPLQCGDYQLDFGVHTDSLDPVDVVFEALRFSVEDDMTISRRPFRSVRANGLCTLPADWSFVESEVVSGTRA